MKRSFTQPYTWLIACGVVSLLAGCNRPKTDSARETGAVGSEDSGKVASGAKVPVTTKSEEARKLYREGQVLFDQIRFHDAHQKFQQAAAKDPEFAMAHYQLATTSPSNKEVVAHTKEAVALAGKASEGERLAILGLQAGVNGDPAKALEYAKEAVKKYPDDERARQNLAFAYSTQQDNEKAVDELNKAIEINPNFATAYNSLGYAYRLVDKNADAEKAFKKYIELVPNDPNPYDSYAELLMRLGRFDESIAQYRKALALDPHFIGSHAGIAGDLMYQGKHGQAIAEAQKLEGAARDDGERRFGMFTQTVIYADQGRTDQALRQMEKQYAFDSKGGDQAQVAGDAEVIGDILLDAGKPDQALKRYQQAVDLRMNSGLSPEAKEDATLAQHYDLARVALAKNDLATAKSEAAEYLKGAEAKQNGRRTQQAHELAGTIALKEKNFDQAISELKQTNQQDPYVVYVLALAFQGKGDKTKAAELFKQSAESYTLPTLNYALIRAKARRQAAAKSTP
ncbi:MAG: tetratricopeptide repeat protein [Gemmatimonadales bacterium]